MFSDESKAIRWLIEEAEKRKDPRARSFISERQKKEMKENLTELEEKRKD